MTINIYGIDNLNKSGMEVRYFNSNLGEWMFRNLAFPELSDNTEEYFNEFYPGKEELKRSVLEKKAVLKNQLNYLVDDLNLSDVVAIGFSSKFQQQIPSIALSRIIKERNPETVIFMGGPNCEHPAGEALSKHIDCIDYIFNGRRCTIGICELVKNLLAGTPENIERIPGVFSLRGYKDGSNVNFCSANMVNKLGIEDDINDVIYPDYNAYLDSKDEYFSQHLQPVLFFETSRGCSWGEKNKCNFCGIDGYNSKHRKMSIQNAKRYLSEVLKYSDRCRYFVATDSCLPREYIQEVFKTLSVPDHVLILYEARVDMTENELQILSKARIKLLIAGIESLSTKVLRLLDKGCDAFQNIKFLKNCRLHGIAVNWNILTAIPGEKKGELKLYSHLIPKIRHLYPPTGIWDISFQGPSRYVEDPKRYGIELEPYIRSGRYLYPYDDQVLGKLSYFHMPVKSDNTSSQRIWDQRISTKIWEWKKSWFQEFDDLPNLYLDDGNVFDTRGKKIVTPLSDAEVYTLSLLSDPMTPDQLADKLSSDADKYLQKFNDHGWLFYEDNNYLSLVLPYRPVAQYS